MQTTWAKPEPPKEEPSTLEQGIGLAASAFGAVGDMFQTHAPEDPMTLQEFDRLQQKYRPRPRKGIRH